MLPLNVFGRWEDFRDLYFFDMKLKQYTLFKVFDIESRLRTSIAYNFASVYCKSAEDTMNYTNPAFYKAPDASDKHMCNIFPRLICFEKRSFFRMEK